jgi:1,4-alpha-glucan branching enzyme
MKTAIDIVLHCHLPYVHHQEDDPRTVHERSFFWSMAETYLPLVAWLDSLDGESVGGTLALAISPTLWSMMDDPVLRERTGAYLETTLEVAVHEAERLSGGPFAAAAAFHLERRRRARDTYAALDRDVVGALIGHAHKGTVALLPVAGSAVLPLLATPELKRAQVRWAIRGFKARFALPVTGVWLPECGYEPDLDAMLADEGVRYTFVGADAFAGAHWGADAPILTQRGLALLPTHFGVGELWQQRWRDDYMDTGAHSEPAAVAQLDDVDDLRSSAGLHLFRVSDATNGHREPYRPDAGAAKVRDHALSFLRGLTETVETNDPQRAQLEGRPRVVVRAFDADTFGRLWPEGTGFLEALLGAIREHEDLVGASGDTLLDRWPRLQVTGVPTSTSRPDSGFGPWLAPANRWVHRHLHRVEDQLVGAVPNAVAAGSWPLRAANVALRLLMLAQCPELLATLLASPSAGYAIECTERLVGDAGEVLRQLGDNQIDRELIERLEQRTAFVEGVDVSLTAP